MVSISLWEGPLVMGPHIARNWSRKWNEEPPIWHLMLGSAGAHDRKGVMWHFGHIFGHTTNKIYYSPEWEVAKFPCRCIKGAMKSISYTQGKGCVSPSHPTSGLGHREQFLLIFLGFAMFMTSSLAAVSLYHVIALKEELASVTSKLNGRVQARTRSAFPSSRGDLDKSKEARALIPLLQVSCRRLWELAWFSWMIVIVCIFYCQGMTSRPHQNSQQQVMWNVNKHRGKRSPLHTGETGKWKTRSRILVRTPIESWDKEQWKSKSVRARERPLSVGRPQRSCHGNGQNPPVFFLHA